MLGRLLLLSRTPTMAFLVLFAIVLALSWANGANDNFKGVATLYGSRTLSFRRSLILATAATAAGALASAFLAGRLARAFSGQGLVSPELCGEPVFLASVGGSAALTILLATWLGMPTSTTHALTGALLGVALAHDGAGTNLGVLVGGFVLPLLLSPVLAMGLAACAEVVLSFTRRNGSRAGLPGKECVCVVAERVPVAMLATASLEGPLMAPTRALRLIHGTAGDCAKQVHGPALRLVARAPVDALHALSAGTVCFARALNDTPKIGALLFAAGGAAGGKLALVAGAMILGGLLHSRKVAETMSQRITPMTPAQGLAANLVTASLVLGASRIGVPVSTTHVSVGSLFGLGAAKRAARWDTVRLILATWLTTFPFAFALGAGAWLLRTSWGSAS